MCTGTLAKLRTVLVCTHPSSDSSIPRWGSAEHLFHGDASLEAGSAAPTQKCAVAKGEVAVDLRRTS
jgi:hypothetical protein